MKKSLLKGVLAAAIALIGIHLCYPAQYGNVSPAKKEMEAADALNGQGVPLQHDPRGVVRWIEAAGGELNDEAMRHLPDLPGLEWLEIGGGAVTSSGVSSLKDCISLRRLYIHDINLKGDSLAWLANLKNLEALSLQRTGIDGSVLRNLKAPGLKVLNLSGNEIKDEDMEQIAAMRLEVLSLADTRISGAGIAKLEGTGSLNELNIMNCSIKDNDLEYFLTMPNLRIVYAAGCGINDWAIQTVVSRFPMLAIFR